MSGPIRILKVIIFLFLFFVALPMLSSSFAQQTGVDNSLKPVNIQLENQNLSQGTLTAQLKISNPNPLIYRAAYYTVKLQGADIARTTTVKGQNTTEFTPGPLIYTMTSDKFDLGALENKNFSLNLSYTTALTSGDYKIEISVFSDGNILIGGFAQDVRLSGSGTFLEISKCVLVVNQIEFDPIIGPNVAPKGQINGKCLVTNPSNSTLTVFSQSEYAVNSVSGKKGNQIFSDKNPITLAPRSAKSVNFALPILETPQVYESLSYLQDAQGNIVSPRVAFRWVIAGESSLIRSIKLDKSDYKAGEMAKVTVGADPSMDLYWRGGGPSQHIGQMSASSSGFITPENPGTPLTDASISVSITDDSNRLCGTANQKVAASPNQNIWPDQVLNVSINKDCVNPNVTVKVLNNGKELASKEIQVPVLVETEQQSRKISSWWILVAVALLGAVLVAVIYRWKKNNPQPPQNPPIDTPNTTSTPSAAVPASIKPVAGLIIAFTLLGVIQLLTDLPSISSFSFVKTSYAATELGPGVPISVHYEGINAYRRGQLCPGPVWTPTNPQPQKSDGKGGCLIEIVTGHDETNFTFLNTQDQIVYQNNSFIVPISGQFTGYGCGNSQIGLIVRAYINGSSQGVKINGGSSRAVFDNLGLNGGGAGTNFTKNLTITPGEENICGPKSIKIELIPYIKHAGLVASDMQEDQLFTDADIPGWSEVTYNNRQNCASGGSCFGVLQKSNINTVSCLACNQACESTDQCVGNVDGCVECRPNESGQNVCQPPPLACNASCSDSKDCLGNKDGCVSCEPNAQGTGKVCAKPPVCGTSCVRDDQCAGAVKDGCTVCLPNSAGSGSICSKPPACGNNCVADYQCAGAKDGCSVCAANEFGQKICQEPFDEGACKCDGFNAINLQNPANSNFQFEAFAKVEGANVTKAAVKSIQFQMTKSSKSNPNAGTVIASSDTITPNIVSSSGNKVRYRATWSVTPPAYDPNGVYRVFSNIKCGRRSASGSAYLSAVLGDTTYNSDSNQLVQKELNYSPVRLAQANNYLEMDTLKDGYFTKITETDSCRFIRFEYGQY